MKLETFIIFILTTISTFCYGQINNIEINGKLFSFKQVAFDTIESGENILVELYRNNIKLITHTIFKEEGDCSSNHIQLGNYEVKNNKITFYSYWASTDRMPGSMLPYGFREQIYYVDSLGILKLDKANIYIENYVTTKNKKFIEKNGWKHKGLKYLNEPTNSKYEKILLEDYIKNVEKEYNAKFVLNKQKDLLEKKVRESLKKEINIYTKNWIAGSELFGRIKK